MLFQLSSGFSHSSRSIAPKRETITAAKDIEDKAKKLDMESHVLAQRTQYAADIEDLKASIDTTRRALDPEQLGEHVGKNIDQFMGEHVETFVDGIVLNRDAAKANIDAIKQNAQIAKTIQDKTDKFDQQSRSLANIATRLEDRDQRSKWDWATLAAAMAVAAGLAGSGAFYFAADQIRTNDFDRSVRLITQDDDAYWCGQADGQIINSQSGAKFCAIHMPSYVEPEPAE